MTQKTLPISQIKSGLCKKLKFFFTDIDDTLTTKGLLPAHSYSALFDLHRAGIKVVAVTGRPGGWCDMIARFWPVEAVIGENGAFYFSYNRVKKKMKRSYFFDHKEQAKIKTSLDKIKQKITQDVPNARISADQNFRLWDLAVDFKEDLTEPLSTDEVKKICRIFENEGARYKVSSIHVNGWFGDFDKLSCVHRFLEEQTVLSWDEARESIIYIGDSPNDEPLFAGIDQTIGVANLKEFWDQLEYFPRYLTYQSSALGFEEAVQTIIQLRS